MLGKAALELHVIVQPSALAIVALPFALHWSPPARANPAAKVQMHAKAMTVVIKRRILMSPVLPANCLELPAEDATAPVGIQIHS
jgi:hypothetical protein